MNSKNICQENEQELQQAEWKWSWRDEYLKWLCGGIEDSNRMLEGLPNKINEKLGIVTSVNIHKAYGAENVR